MISFGGGFDLHAVEHAEKGSEGKTSGQHRLHLDQRQIAVVILQLFFIALDLLLVLFVQRIAECFLSFFDWNEQFKSKLKKFSFMRLFQSNVYWLINKTYVFCFVSQFQSWVFEICPYGRRGATSILEGQHIIAFAWKINRHRQPQVIQLTFAKKCRTQRNKYYQYCIGPHDFIDMNLKGSKLAAIRWSSEMANETIIWTI